MSTQQRWSYLTVEIKTGMLLAGLKTETLQAELTKHGNLGWELVQIITGPPRSAPALVFKRPQ